MVKILLISVVVGLLILAFLAANFAFIAFLVPTSAPYQYEEWNTTIEATIFGVELSKLAVIRLQIAAIGLGVVICLLGSAWFLWRLSTRF